MNNNKLENLEQTVDEIQNKIELIGNTLNLIISELGDENTEFQAKFISSTLSVDKFRDEFTKFVNEEGDDDIKFTMIEVNEMIERLKNGE
jgi:tetrahydromethanopterin S-methyltransferase subunit B